MKAINAFSKNYPSRTVLANASDMMLAVGDNSENTQHIQAKNHMIFADFTTERKSRTCKPYLIRLTWVVERRWVVLGLKSNDLQSATNEQEWRMAT